jgi:hypothetical protein
MKLFSWVLIGFLMGCAGEETPTAPVPEPVVTLIPETQLVSGCFNWPQEEFSAANHAIIGINGVVGEPAIEFTLKDLAGATHTLSSLLESRPVLLVFGSFT